MFCRKCGAEIRPKAKFCAKCGAPVPAPAGSSVPPAVPLGASPVRPPKVLTDPVKPAADPVKPAETLTPEETKPKLIINMPKTTASSSNGQFDEWFSEPDDLS